MGRAADSTAWLTMSEAVLAVSAERSVDEVLDRLVHAARDLAGARYAAIGVPDDDDPTAFAQFLTAGMTDELIDQLGELPRTHGMLGATLVEQVPFRTDDITKDPRFRGWWPSAHPSMHSFLGVPIVRHGQVLGAFYLTEKEDEPAFSDEDQRIIELLAAHAALALEHAHLHEAGRERNIAEERNRLARELHDSLNQLLFSLSLTAEAAAAAIDQDPASAAELMGEVKALAGQAQAELRVLVEGLRPADLDALGLLASLRQRADLLARVYGTPIDVVADGDPDLEPAAEREAYRVVQEAVSNALRHSGADHITVSVDAGADDGATTITVADDGHGFDTAAHRGSGRRLGLVTMRERAKDVGGTLELHSEVGRGTTITLVVPGA